MKKLNFTKTVKNTFLGKFFILGLLSTSSFLNAQVFNVNFAPLNFSANNQSVITGTLNAANSQVLYTNVITINGQVMDCIVTNLDGSTTFDQDWRSNPNAAPGNTTDALRVDSMFSPILSNTMSGSSLNVFKRFKFDFVTKFGSNTFYSPVILDNVVLNVYDVDREGTGNIKNSVKISKGNYNTFEAISTSVGYNNTDPDMLSFYQSNPSSNTNTTYAGVIADAHRYRFTFSNLTSFEISLGEERTSGGNSTTITSNYF